jgi:hypothetical protein
MSWTELHLTLTGLVSAVQPAPGAGLRVERAELTVPLEATASIRQGTVVLLGRVPHSRWRSGFLPAVHTGHLVIEAVESDDGGQRHER